jgi:GGDEF domain-containing protein
MNRKFTTAFAAVCIAAALGAATFVAYRILAQNAAGREAAKVDFEGLRSVLAYVKSPSDLADPSLRARLASRYEASPGLLLVDVYERGTGDRWRIPAESPYLDEAGRSGGTPRSSYPPASTLLLSAPLKGDSSGKLAVDALYVSLTQASAFGAFRDALIGLGTFLAVAALVLAAATGSAGRRRPEPSFDFSKDATSGGASEPSAVASASAIREKRVMDKPAAEKAAREESFAAEWSAEEKAAAAAQYQFETLEAEEERGDILPPPEDEEFDIPVMDMGLVVKSAPEELPAVGEASEAATPDAQAAASSSDDAAPRGARAVASPDDRGEARKAADPAGLYSPSSGLGWESYMKERLDAEISRSASFEQDLSLLAFCYDGLTSHDEAYASIGKLIKEYFSFRDLVFERGDDGFSIILPNIDSSHAIRMAEEFNKKLVFLAEGDFAELELLPIYMGISSRAGRLVDAGRLIEEASTALERARYAKETHIVAFRPDPDKYRRFLASKTTSQSS